MRTETTTEGQRNDSVSIDPHVSRDSELLLKNVFTLNFTLWKNASAMNTNKKTDVKHFGYEANSNISSLYIW